MSSLTLAFILSNPFQSCLYWVIMVSFTFLGQKLVFFLAVMLSCFMSEGINNMCLPLAFNYKRRGGGSVANCASPWGTGRTSGNNWDQNGKSFTRFNLCVIWFSLYRRSVLPWTTSGLLLVMRKALNDGNSAVQWMVSYLYLYLVFCLK